MELYYVGEFLQDMRVSRVISSDLWEKWWKT